MLEGIRDKLSIWWINRFLGGFKGKHNYKNDEIYLFSSDIPYSGMALASYEIAVNESIVEEENEKVLEMVYLHEKQHLNDHIISVLTGISQMVILSPLFLIANFVILLGLSIVSISGMYPPGIGSNLLLKILSADLLISFSAILISQFGELRAEMNALDEMGLENMREARKNLRDLVAEPGLLTSISLRLTHPPLVTVERFYKLTNRE